MGRRIGAAGVLFYATIGACQVDSREPEVLSTSLVPATEGGLLVQPSSLAYGPITLAFVASARVRIENLGSTPLEPPHVSLEGDGASAFTLTQNDCTAALSGGASCALAVAFRPSDLSPRQATLRITGSSRNIGIPLSGSGLEPGGLVLQARDGEASFGDVPLQGEQEVTLQLGNPTASASGPIELISNNAAFSLIPARGGECASSEAVLASGQSCEFRVRFAPVLRGVTDATITARSSVSGSVSLGVSGRALAAARILVDQPRLDFGAVPVAAGAVLDVAISNGGDEPLPPVTGHLSGTGASAFRVSDNGCSAPLMARQSCSISVSFSPAATGPHVAVLDLDAGSAGSLRVDLSGAGLVAGNLLVLPADGSASDFGAILLGADSERAFRVSNISGEASGPITLGVNSAEFSIEPPDGAECASGVTDLASGAVCDVRVRFAPVQRRARNANLTVSARVGGTAINLSGVGLAPATLGADGPVDFGSVSQGNVTSRSISVTNPGDEMVTRVTTSLSGRDADRFSVQRNGCESGVAAQGSCFVSILFAPTTTGSHLAALTVEGEPAGTFDLSLSGAGLAPALLGVQPSAIVFDTPVLVGQTARQSLTVSNRGDTPAGRVSATNASGSAGFFVTSGTCSAALLPGESCVLDVGFAPEASGPHTGAIRVSATPGGTLEVPVSGTGNFPAALALVALESTDFGGVGIGASATGSFTLRNDGDVGAGTLLGIALGPGFALAPRVGAECSPNTTVLDGGASCAFRVLFQPTRAGYFTVTMVATTSLAGDTELVLAGAGLSPPVLTASAARLAFTEPIPIVAQGSETLTWTVTNTGGSPTEELVFTNSNPDEFRVAFHNCFDVLYPGVSCEVPFQFAPDVVGQRTSTMTLSAGALSVSLMASGTGLGL